jgi:hypothetical protein
MLPAEDLGRKDIGGAASAAAVKRRVKSKRSIDISHDSVPNELREVESRIFVCSLKVDPLHCWPR